MDIKTKPYVITGGPGIGKTTLIELLLKKGFRVVAEAARVIIEEERAKNSDALPWKDLAKFQELVARRQLENEGKIDGYPVFLDRGIPDGYGYCLMGNISPPRTVEDNARARYEKVFILDRLPTHVLDSVRFEDTYFAEKVHEAIREAYIHYGYSPIRVPAMPGQPEKQVDFILKNLS